MSSIMITLTDPQNIDEHLAHPDTAVLFALSYCPFYRTFRPSFDKFAKAHPEKYHYLTVLLDDHENPLWDTYAVKVSPTVIVFKNGKVCKRLDGVEGKGLSEKDLLKL